jgi:transcriptional regulator
VYRSSLFAEDRPEVLHDLIHRHPLATVVTADASGPQASHVPMILHSDLGPRGVLRCHLTRANPHWKPRYWLFSRVNHYIAPSWYPTKQEHGKVVPTWSCVAVHIRGPARLFEDLQQLVLHLNELANQQEQAFEKPWPVSDAPGDYIAALSQSIIGIEISIEAIKGK